MILLHAVLLTSVLLPALSAPTSSETLARVTEARARVAENRAKLRARISNRFRSPASARSKRQPEYYNGAYLPPPPPPPPQYLEPYQNVAYEEEESVPVHICSVEDEYESARSAEEPDQQSAEDFHLIPEDSGEIASDGSRMSSVGHFSSVPENAEEQSHNGDSKMSPKSAEDQQTQEETVRAAGDNMNEFFQDGGALDKALEEISEAREILDKFEEEHSRHSESGFQQRPNSKFPGSDQFNKHPHQTGTPSEVLHGRNVQNLMDQVRAAINSEEKAVEKMEQLQEMRIADAHVHHRLHSHEHTVIHGHSTLPIAQTHVVTPGLHLPQAQVVTPSLNLNINQNQGTNQGLTPGLHQPGYIQPGLHQPGLHHTPLANQGVFSSVNQGGTVSPYNQPLFTSRTSGFENLEKDAEADAHQHPHAPPIHHGHNPGHKFHPIPHGHNPPFVHAGHNPHHGPHFQEGHGKHRSSENLDMREAEEVEENESTVNLNEEDALRDAVPTLHKLKNKFKPQYPVYSPYPQQYGKIIGPYRDAEDEETVSEGQETEDSNLREASPTLHKLKNKLKPQYPVFIMYPQQYPQQYPQHYPQQYPLQYGQNLRPYYRDAEDDEEPEDVSDEARDADPTIKKLKRKFKSQSYQPYPTYGGRPQYSGPYREAEEEDAESRQGDDSMLQDSNTSSFLFNVPARRRFSDQYKRSVDKELDELLGIQRQIVDSLEKKSENDEDMKLVADISNRTLTNIEEQRNKITKRSVPLTRLIHDPNVRLDVPKTIENFGTATKNAFEDERAPMYHFKNMVGSSKNAMLSAMRVPPQNMIIPSDYEIIKSSGNGARSKTRQDQEDPFGHTFRRVGEMVRESIKSGQDTAGHIGDVAHSARNMIHSARHSVPRLVIPYAQVPALKKKTVLITPKIMDLSHETSRKSDPRPNFVRLGHLMDAVGLSRPDSKKLDLEKIIFEPRRISEARVDDRLAQIYSRFRDNYDDDADTVSEAISNLEDAKISVGAQNLRDFLVKMKNELTHMVSNTPGEYKKKQKKSKKQETKEMGRFIETLFDGSRERSKKEETKTEEKEETVGSGMFLSPELMHPFMGRASEVELQNFLRENGDIDIDKFPNLLQQKKEENPKSRFEELRSANPEDSNHSDLGYVLGAINPLMFERMYNQTVKVNNNNPANPKELFQKHHFEESDDNATVGTTMNLSGPMTKPFMGQIQPDRIEKFLDTYNKDQNVDYVQIEE